MRTAVATSIQDEIVFHEYAARGAYLAKRDNADMRECHTVSAALAGVLQELGYRDARVVGCSAIATSSAGDMSSAKVAMAALGAEPAHSVVLAAGYLIDPTAGQFRSRTVKIPDYLVIKPHLASEMLADNRKFIETGMTSPLNMMCEKSTRYDYRVAYIPTGLVWH